MTDIMDASEHQQAAAKCLNEAARYMMLAQQALEAIHPVVAASREYLELRDIGARITTATQSILRMRVK